MNIYGKIVERLTSTYVILKSQDTKNEKEILNVSRVGVGGGKNYPGQNETKIDISLFICNFVSKKITEWYLQSSLVEYLGV